MLVAPRVLVIRRRYLGDIVLLGALFRNLRIHWPNAHLAALIEAPYEELLRLNPDVNAMIILPKRTARFKGWAKLLSSLRSHRFTHVLDLNNTAKTALFTRFTGAKMRVALLHEPPPRLPFLYTHVVLDPPKIHEKRSITEYYLQALQPLGITVASRETRLHLQTADLLEARRLLNDIPFPAAGPRLLVHPGSRSTFRLWPAERFAEVIDRAQAHFSSQVILIGGPTDQDIVSEIRLRCQRPPIVFEKPLPVGQFAALASLCDLMLCHDSGPMHVAAAIGIPVVALLGSQNPVLFAPTGEGHTLLSPPLPCQECVAPAECVPGDSYRNYCVRRLSVDQVWTEIAGRLSAMKSNTAEQRHG
jgi:lipopolysaccharide heptosyltransferase II